MSEKSIRELIAQYQKKNRIPTGKRPTKKEEQERIKAQVYEIEKSLRPKKPDPTEQLMDTYAVSGKNIINPQDTYLGDMYEDWATQVANGNKYSRQLCTFGGVRQ